MTLSKKVLHYHFFWSTDRKTFDTQLEHQVDIGGAQKINGAKYLIIANQTAARIEVPNEAKNIAVFDNLNVRKNHSDIDGVGYLLDGFSIDYTSNDYVDQDRDLNFFLPSVCWRRIIDSFYNLY